MSNALLTVVAEMVAKPGKEDELKRHLISLVDPTRKEDGCVQYDLNQDTSEAGRFVFYECWRSRELLERHLQSPHLLAFRSVEKELVAGPGRVVACTRIA
jgi:quinol monooxygenase YgiN